MRLSSGVGFAVRYKTQFMKVLFIMLFLTLGVLCSQPSFAQDSSKLNNVQTKLDRSQRKEVRLRKKSERKQKKLNHKQNRLARQEKKSAKRERKRNREQRKLERQQEKTGTAPSQSAFMFTKPQRVPNVSDTSNTVFYG